MGPSQNMRATPIAAAPHKVTVTPMVLVLFDAMLYFAFESLLNA
jgi:hypothetical protein